MATYAVKQERSSPLLLDPSPSAVHDGDALKEFCRRQVEGGARLAVDLFSGAGGLSLGLEETGWTVALGVDNNANAVASHRGNFGGLALQANLASRAELDYVCGLVSELEIDLIAGGPPCQPFSRAGRSKIRSLVANSERPSHDARKDLWQSFVAVVEAAKPRAVLIENVPDMGLADDAIVVRKIMTRLSDLGYEVDAKLVDAWRHQVPQHRRRLFVCARNDGQQIRWPEAAEHIPRVRDAIGDLPSLEGGTGARVMARDATRLPLPLARALMHAADKTVVHDHFTRPVRPDDLKAFGGMSEGTRYSDLPIELRRYSVDSFDDKYKRLGWDSLSRTITAHIAKDGYWYIHPDEHRTLTVREAARIQTFPDTFRFAGTRSHAFQQIGNAVPPKLAAAVSRALLPQPEGEPCAPLTPRVDLLRRLADRDRRQRWWLYPARRQTPLIALAVVTLKLGTLETQQARQIVEMLSTKRDQAAEATECGRAVSPSVSARSWRRFSEILDELAHGGLDWDEIERALRPAERARFQNLLGAPTLVVSARSTRAAALVLRDDRATTGAEATLLVARAVQAKRGSPTLMAALESLPVAVLAAAFGLPSTR